MTITGSGFTGATAVDFGPLAATIVSVSATTITAYSPPGTGTVDVIVITPSGPSATSPADQFTYQAVPTVSGLVPNAGPTVGGTTVIITGTGFTGATAVDFGTDPGTGLIVTSDTSLTVISPPGFAGTVNVTVIAPGGTSLISPADQFTYVAAPTVSGVSPTSGPAAGGTLVTITGTGFTGTMGVDFGTTPATDVTVVSDGVITAISPAGTGTVNVTVTTTGGTSAAVPADLFTYGPTVSSISPSNGPLGGGTVVTITGTGFLGVTAVDFGTTPATSFTVVSATSIIAVSPPSATGMVVDVTVTTPGGTSPASAADQFAYLGVPTISLISPNSGPSTGGTEVTITGTNLADVTAVNFGTAAATTLISDSATQIVVLSPASTVFGPVNVTVTTPGGTSPISPADLFYYSSALGPSRRGSPASVRMFGPPSGGTLVTIKGSGFDPGTPTTVYFGLTTSPSVIVVNSSTIVAVSPPGHRHRERDGDYLRRHVSPLAPPISSRTPWTARRSQAYCVMGTTPSRRISSLASTPPSPRHRPRRSRTM